MSTMGKYRGGPAKVAVLASSFFGTISGSAVANVLVDGPITIPMMRKSGFPRHLAAATEAVASTGGLTWKDVKPVPVTGAFDSPRALGADRVEAAWASLGMPVVREIHAKKKVRYLSFENTPKTISTLRRMVFLGVKLVTMPPIKRLGLSAPTSLMTFDSYLLTHKDADPVMLREIMDALWANTDELRKVHFSLRGGCTNRRPPACPCCRITRSPFSSTRKKGFGARRSTRPMQKPCNHGDQLFNKSAGPAEIALGPFS